MLLNGFLPKDLQGKYSFVDGNNKPIRSNGPGVQLNKWGFVNVAEINESKIKDLIGRKCPFLIKLEKEKEVK